MAIGIYKITNLLNNKCYIGQSVNIEKRWSKHKSEAFNKLSTAYNYPLYQAMRKYGLENFSFEIIEQCLVAELSNKEQYWIQYFDSFFHGYNQTLGGQNATHQIDKEKIIGIITDLETTYMKHREIAEKWGVSIETVQGINTGRYWKQDREYPIQKQLPNKYPKHNYCIDCGKEILKTSIRCNNCEAKHRSSKTILPISREELKNLIRSTSFLQIGNMFGVSDNAIRKWCDKYKLPRKKTDIKLYSDEDWEKI